MAGAVDRRLGAAYADVRETRSLLTNASDSIPDGLAIFNADGRLTLANAAYREIFPGLGNNSDGRSHYDDVLANQFETSDKADGSGPLRFEELLGRSDNFSEREELLKDGRRLLIRDRLGSNFKSFFGSGDFRKPHSAVASSTTSPR